MKKIIIIGAGPAGLSTGYHLKNAGFNDFLILEKNSYAGGLSASFADKKGFVWDLGGHVIHHKNKKFIKFAKRILKNQLYLHERKAFVYFKNRLIPYPFQNNIAFLPENYKKECLEGLTKTQSTLNHSYLQNRLQRIIAGTSGSGQAINNFHSWIVINFGAGIAKYFMIPQNEKSWQYPLKKMSTCWLPKRVSFPSLKKIKKECQKKKPKIITWGSNQHFFYPKEGGIGNLWVKCAGLMKNNIKFNSKVTKVDFLKKKLFCNRKALVYNMLISTMPLNELVKIFNAPLKIKKTASQLKYNSGLVIGLGFAQKPIINNWQWIYFPEKKYPFFRACLLSNFSQKNIPNLNFSSILVEIAWRNRKPNIKKLIPKVTQQIGKIFFKNENIKPISIFSHVVPYYYPIPILKRDKILKEIKSFLKTYNVYSFGRFGGWKYEEGNMDDCFKEALKVKTANCLSREASAKWG